MTTTLVDEFDYQTYFRTHSLDPAEMIRGAEAREKRLQDLSGNKAIIRIDKDILAQFERLAPNKQVQEALICRALREWLFSQDVKALIRDDFRNMLQDALALTQIANRPPAAPLTDCGGEHIAMEYNNK